MIEDDGGAVATDESLASRLPPELDSMPPGAALAVLLESVDRGQLGPDELLRLAQARNRLLAHQQAQLLADLHQVARTVPDQGSQPGRRELPGKYPWAEVEVAFALTWSNAKAGGELELSDDLIDRLPQVFAKLDAGQLDRPKAWVIQQATAGLDDEVARAVVDRLIDHASTLTTGQLAARLRRLVLAADPQVAQRRARQEIGERRVQAFLNDNNLGALCGYELAPHRVAAAMERMTAIARAAKAGGDPRKIDQLRADVMLDLLVGDGVAAGGAISDGGLESAPPRPGDREPQAPDASTPWPPAPTEPDRHTMPEPRLPAEPLLSEPLPAGPLPAEPLPAEPAEVTSDMVADAEQEELKDLWYAGFAHLSTTAPASVPVAAGSSAAPVPGAEPAVAVAPRRGVVDLQVPLTTLIGLSRLPGDLDGWGPVIADICRQVVAQQPDAQWRFSVYDRLGELASHGITNARPVSSRRPAASDTAFVRARDRHCRAPGCRRPARHCDVDHTLDWLHSKDSRRCNLACLCRRHHLFKHSPGAELVQLAPGVLGWSTPAGMRYVTHPDEYPAVLEPADLNDLPPPENDERILPAEP